MGEGGRGIAIDICREVRAQPREIYPVAGQSSWIWLEEKYLRCDCFGLTLGKILENGA
jgi:hypothetical protein